MREIHVRSECGDFTVAPTDGYLAMHRDGGEVFSWGCPCCPCNHSTPVDTGQVEELVMAGVGYNLPDDVYGLISGEGIQWTGSVAHPTADRDPGDIIRDIMQGIEDMWPGES